MQVNLYCHKAVTPPYLNQIFTGFKALQDLGSIQLELIQTRESVFADPTLPITRLRNPDGQALPQDLADERYVINELGAACIRACRK